MYFTNKIFIKKIFFMFFTFSLKRYISFLLPRTESLPCDVSAIIGVFTVECLWGGVDGALKVGDALVIKRHETIARRVPFSSEVRGEFAGAICRGN